MAPFSRSLARRDVLRVAVGAAGLAILLMVGAYALALTTSPVSSGAVVSALALVVIAGAGLLYAWRLGAGGIAD